MSKKRSHFPENQKSYVGKDKMKRRLLLKFFGGIFIFLLLFSLFPRTLFAKRGKITMVIAPENFRDEEFFIPKRVFEDNGYEVSVVSLYRCVAKGMLGSAFRVEKTIYDIDPRKIDALVIVGGSGATCFWNLKELHKKIRMAFSLGKVVAAICISPLTLANAGIIKGMRATGWPSIARDMRGMGVIYTGRGVERSKNVITAKGPPWAKEFAETILEALGEN